MVVRAQIRSIKLKKMFLAKVHAETPYSDLTAYIKH